MLLFARFDWKLKLTSDADTVHVLDLPT